MDYEKEYKKRLDDARYWHDVSEGDIPLVLEEIFSELRESEDEKIRKAILAGLIDCRDAPDLGWSDFGGINIDECIAWLEKQNETKEINEASYRTGIKRVLDNSESYGLKKQGEQKPVVIIPKFRVGDEVETGNEESLTITRIDEEGYWSNDLFICGFDNSDEWELVEQKPGDKVEPKLTEFEDAVKGMMDVYREAIGANDATAEEAKKHAAYLLSLIPHKSAKWSEEDEEHLNSIISDIKTDMGAYPRSQEVIDIYNDDISFLKSLRDRVQPQPKQEWSEDDEKTLEGIINAVKDVRCQSLLSEIDIYDDYIDWLKSLKQKMGWKPSDAQMQALKEACDKHWEPDGLDPLYTLYEQLKKL